jgi:hypothetical protein
VADPAPKRRLPVVQPRDDDEALPRPPWQRVAIGAAATLLAWVLLANVGGALASAAARSIDGPAAAIVALGVHLGALSLAAMLGGVLAARSGAVSAREPALAGGAAVIVGWSLAGLRGAGGDGDPAGVGFAAALVVLAAIGASAAALGARVDRRFRARRGAARSGGEGSR